MPPKVSIIINCLNSATFLEEALQSVVAQTVSDWEVLFWDNCSTDNSAAIAASFGDRVKVIQETSETIPLGQARNKALAHASGEYIAFLDCDDYWAPTHLATHIAYLDAHPEYGFSYSNFKLVFEDSRAERVVFESEQPSGHIFTDALSHYPIGILTVVMRRSLLESLSEWFDPNLNLVEDYDFFLRVVHNTMAKYHHEVLGFYRNHSQNTTKLNVPKFATEMLATLDKFEATLSLTSEERHIIAKEKRFQQFRDIYHRTYKKKRYGAFIFQLIAKRAFPFTRILSVLKQRRKNEMLVQ